MYSMFSLVFLDKQRVDIVSMSRHFRTFIETIFFLNLMWLIYSTSEELCTRFARCCVLLWLYTSRFYSFSSILLHPCWCKCVIASMPVKQHRRMWVRGPYIARKNVWYNHNKIKHNKYVGVFYRIYCNGWRQLEYKLRVWVGTLCINSVVCRYRSNVHHRRPGFESVSLMNYIERRCQDTTDCLSFDFRNTLSSLFFIWVYWGTSNIWVWYRDLWCAMLWRRSFYGIRTETAV